MVVIKSSKRISLIISISVILLVAVVIGLYLYPITALKQLDNKQVESVGFVGEGENIVYDYPEDEAKALIEILKSAKLKGFPTKDYAKVVGGGPMMITAIEFEDKSRITLSYRYAPDKEYLIINTKGYLCDIETLDKFKKICTECYSAYKATWYTMGNN